VKLCRFFPNGLGVVEGDQVADVTDALRLIPNAQYPFPREDGFIAHLSQICDAARVLLPTARHVPLASLTLLSPVGNPGKLVAAPVNYVKHLKEVLGDKNLHHDNQINEIQRAGLFLKATSSLVGPSEGVRINQPQRRTDHEIELAVVIGRTAKDVLAKNALAYVAGYTMALDITIRGPEERSMRKSPDGYTVLGPWLVTADEIADPGTLDFELQVNGVRRQQSNTADLILGVAELIEFATRFYTLHPGDVLLTGTPEGVSPILPGEEMHARMDGIGEMRVKVLNG
jgi:2-keto-4-pentenoate hydratase/2-oxohepta-3-ene-1,7-dioic acid hydratase in catechol pathway